MKKNSRAKDICICICCQHTFYSELSKKTSFSDETPDLSCRHWHFGTEVLNYFF